MKLLAPDTAFSVTLRSHHLASVQGLAQCVLLAVGLGLALPVAAAPPPSASLVQEDTGPSGAELKADIDLSLRWLRGQQDVESGRYGESDLATVWAVAALAESPRAYRPGDGPFLDRALDWLVSAAGAEGTLGKSDNPELVAIARLALRRFEAERYDTAREQLEARLAHLRKSWPWPNLTQEFHSGEVGRQVARAFLSKRRDDGSWDGPRGAVVETAQLAWELSRAHRAIAAEEKEQEPAAAGASSEAVALPTFAPTDRTRAEESLRRGSTFLAEAAANGRWGVGDRPDPGITAMVLGALLAAPEPRSDETQAAIDGGLDWLRSLQNEDGSIHAGQLANYVTSASVLAFVRAGHEEDQARIERARDFLVRLQADEGEGYNENDRYYGGVGYGGDERPDLSNLQMALEAMRESGLAEDDPAFGKALSFLQRVQNRSESNDLELVSEGTTIRPGDDGGAGYAPGESKAGFVELPDGTKVPRSYGSMTYALLRGYLFAGLERDDARVQAAWKWLQENYTLDINPGFEASGDPAAAFQGLFYYFYTMARALDLYGVDVLEDAAGTEHAWRSELAGRLVSMQRADGSWLNANSPRWWEGNPVLATAYAMLALETALPE